MYMKDYNFNTQVEFVLKGIYIHLVAKYRN